MEALRQGDDEAAATSGHGGLDALIHVAIEGGVFEARSVLTIRRARQGIPDALLLRPLAVLPCVEAISLSAAAGRLCDDAALLLQVGSTSEPGQEDFTERHPGGPGNAAPSPPAYKGRFFVRTLKSGGYNPPSPLVGEGWDGGRSQEASGRTLRLSFTPPRHPPSRGRGCQAFSRKQL